MNEEQKPFIIQAKRITQICFFFSYEQVEMTLARAVAELAAKHGEPFIKGKISAGLQNGSGITVTFQQSKDLTP